MIQQEEIGKVLTPRETMMMDYDKEILQINIAHAEKMKQYELKWSNILRIPVIIVKMPLYLILGVAYCIACARKLEPSKSFWDFINK